MAEENRNYYDSSETRDVDVQDRGVLDFLGKKKDSHDNNPQEEQIATDFNHKVNVSDHPQHEEEKKHSLLEKLHRSDSSSSSSSEEEVEEDGKKIKKKKEKKGKGLKEKHHHEESVAVPVEKVEVHHTEEKKGFLDKIKEKLPGAANKKPEEHTTTHPPPPAAEYAETTQHHDHDAHQPHGGEAKEKKGILEKIKEKLPGYHPKSDEEKDKEKESASH